MKAFLSKWFLTRRERYVERMKVKGKCPECRGLGYIITTSPYVSNCLDCYLCEKTGLYTIWEQNK